MRSSPFERFAGLCAILAGIAIFLYSFAFIVIARTSPELGGRLSALFLLFNGLLATAAWAGISPRVKIMDMGFALWAALLGFAGALGAAIHGGYALAILLILIYLGRLVTLDPTNPLLLVPVLPAGFLANPTFYIWLGSALRREQPV